MAAEIVLPDPVGLHRYGDHRQPWGQKSKSLTRRGKEEYSDKEKEGEELVFSTISKKPVSEELEQGLADV